MPHVFPIAETNAHDRFAVVVSRFNESITRKLLDGAVATLTEHGVPDEQVHVAWVPGAWEIPLVAQRLADSQRYRAVICLGAVIRGQTPHFDYVAAETSKGVAHVMLDTDVPLSFGVLTADTLEQAIDRAGAKSGNKGFDAALAALEMANVLKALGTT
jgi:6,7-dimethyl-8-ribityllumazine synthase